MMIFELTTTTTMNLLILIVAITAVIIVLLFVFIRAPGHSGATEWSAGKTNSIEFTTARLET